MDRNFWILYFFPLFCFLVEIYGVLMRKIIKANIIDIEGERGKIEEDGSICLLCACGILHEMIQYFLFMENGGVNMSNIQFYGFEDKTRLSFYNRALITSGKYLYLKYTCFFGSFFSFCEALIGVGCISQSLPQQVGFGIRSLL